ncbi:MAG: carboxymuconolactone decarboxylase family protein [Candidatus Kariarchaeaceae archaeon]|jgi:AhpD family alkylhydroperoxidase
MINERETEIAAIAAATAAGCVPCLEYHYKLATELGFEDEEIFLISNLAYKIRSNAYKVNKSELDSILTGFNDETHKKEYKKSLMEEIENEISKCC